MHKIKARTTTLIIKNLILMGVLILTLKITKINTKEEMVKLKKLKNNMAWRANVF
mgnify:CR=1 FL=1